MIDKMTRYSFILLNGEETAFLEQLQEVGLVDITRSAKPVNAESQKITEEIELLSSLIQGIERLDLPADTQAVPYTGEGSEDPMRLAGGTLMLYSQVQADVERLRKAVEESRVWGQFDPARLEILSQAGVPVHFHALSAKQFDENWAQDYALCIIQYLLKTVNPSTTFPLRLKALLAEHLNVDINAMGFMKDWDKEALWH